MTVHERVPGRVLVIGLAETGVAVARVPALCTAKRSPASVRKKPSAIWERAELCEHRKRTRFIT